VFLLPFVRRALSRIVPIAPDSGIHATALVLAIMALGLGIAQMPLVGGLDTLAASSIQVGVWDSMLSTLPIGLLALIGVGLFVRRTPRDTWKRLGLVRITWQQAGLAVGLALLIVGVSIAIDRAWRVLAPENYEMMDALSEVLYGQLARKWYHAVILSLLIGVSEEIFFRGALQPRFGYLPTAVVFAVAHAQYGLTPASVQILGAALLLGWLRQRTNTTTCIILHALFNALGLLLSPLLP
jgi:membrane protease YdiL (CAAX protease family)